MILGSCKIYYTWRMVIILPTLLYRGVLFVIWTFVQLSNCPFVRIFIYSNSRRALRITNIYFELGHLCGKRGNALHSTYFLCLLQGHKKTASEQSTVNRGVLGGCTHHRPRVELFGRPPQVSGRVLQQV